jgi:hypothetical protein
MADKKAIGGLVKLIANLGLDYIEPRIERALADGSLIEKLALSPFEAVRASIGALSDDDANNSEQLRIIWLNYLNVEVRSILREALEPVIGEIDNVADKDLLSYLADVAFEIVGILTDNVEENKAQLTAFFADLQKQERTRTVIVNKLVDLADGVVKDKALLDLFKTVLNAVFDIIQGKELEPDTLKALGP